MKVLRNYHLRSGAQNVEMASPEDLPWHFALLNSKDEELSRPQ